MQHFKRHFKSAWFHAHRARHLLASEFRRARSRTPGDVGLASEELMLETDDGYCLAAWFIPGSIPVRRTLTIPAAHDFGVVIHHHYGGQRATTLAWASLFTRMGFDVLTFDARGHGRSTELPSYKDSFVQRAHDVRAACDYLRNRGKKYLIGFGQSQGAAVIVNGMARRDDLAGLILDSGPTPEMLSAAWGLSGYVLRGTQTLAGRYLVRGALAWMLAWDGDTIRYSTHLWRSLRAARRCPLLLLHGDADHIVSSHWPMIWFRALAPGNGRWRSVIVPGAGHVLCLQAGGPPLESTIREFLAETTQNKVVATEDVAHIAT